MPIYLCEQLVIDQQASIPWDQITPVPLVDTVTGGAVQEATEVRACWTTEAWHIQFRCKDLYAISHYEHRDDPLYEQDVVEVFIDMSGEGWRYIEIEVSPSNVIFDAWVERTEGGTVRADTSWNMERLVTRVVPVEYGRIYELRLPWEEFAPAPVAGTEWRVNFYRIDEQPDGTREYQAWGPTGEVNFHIPAHFGRMQFVI
ncbi:carbohydrate-binding family 9-like protein [Paenibacillus sanguinis]|uniref:carbohydrate-binding family 9-like protein n=1 Tax=Paenibacillus sanguinis TaxID=225906 RepID=UPI00036609F1|nr:carbohydrate-binding family 9-like protein [Paenibacillus sanguinis]